MLDKITISEWQEMAKKNSLIPSELVLALIDHIERQENIMDSMEQQLNLIDYLEQQKDYEQLRNGG
jgi:hypothetical protein